MKVRATKPGFFNGSLKDVGDEFEVPKGSKSKWFEPIVDTAEPIADDKPKGNKRGGGSRPKNDTAEPVADPTEP